MVKPPFVPDGQTHQEQGRSYKEVCAPVIERLRFLFNELRPAVCSGLSVLSTPALPSSLPRWRRIAQKLIRDGRRTRGEAEGLPGAVGWVHTGRCVTFDLSPSARCALRLRFQSCFPARERRLAFAFGKRLSLSQRSAGSTQGVASAAAARTRSPLLLWQHRPECLPQTSRP